jgi:hypothetical protein
MIAWLAALLANGAAAGAIVTALVAAVLWMLSRWVEVFATRDGRRGERDSLISSLYAEIDFNTRDLELFLLNSADITAIEARIRQSDTYLPHVTDAHHTIIYSSRIADLHHLDDGLTARLVLFYCLLGKIKAQIDGINQPSFSRISANGQITVIRPILANSDECRCEGEAILLLFVQRYPAYGLVRFARKIVDTRQRSA